MWLNIKEGMRQRQGALMSNHSPNLQCLAVVILGRSTKFCVKGVKENLSFCFLKSKAKKKANFSKIIRGRRLFCGEFRSILSKLMFTHSVSCWCRSHGVVEMFVTRKYCYQKLNVRVASRNAEQFMILGNEELLNLFTWVFIDLMIIELADLYS